MNLPDLEKGFRALASATQRQAESSAKCIAKVPEEAVVNLFLCRLTWALQSAADDLDDQIRKQYGIEPRKREDEHGNS